MKFRSALVFVVCSLSASSAFAGAAPELDSSQLGTGLALAGAIIFALAGRGPRKG